MTSLATARGTSQGPSTPSKAGAELKGTFASDLFGINDYRVPGLQGSLIWLTDRFELFDATSGLYGGSTKFSLTMAPLGGDAPGLASFDVNYREVGLAAFTDFLQTQGIRVAGRATGRNLLEWPLGHYAEHRGEGQVTVEPPDGVQVLGRDIPTAVERQPERREPQHGTGELDLGSELLPDRGGTRVHLWSRVDHAGAQLDGHAANLRGVRRPHRLRRALSLPISCDERRLAGERSCAGRIAHGLWRAPRGKWRSGATASLMV